MYIYTSAIIYPNIWFIADSSQQRYYCTRNALNTKMSTSGVCDVFNCQACLQS